MTFLHLGLLADIIIRPTYWSILIHYVMIVLFKSVPGWRYITKLCCCPWPIYYHIFTDVQVVKRQQRRCSSSSTATLVQWKHSSMDMGGGWCHDDHHAIQGLHAALVQRRCRWGCKFRFLLIRVSAQAANKPISDSSQCKQILFNQREKNIERGK